MTRYEGAHLVARGGEAVNLLGVKLSGDLRGLLFEACVEQRFNNPTDKNLEIVYSFPLPWGAVLLGVDVVLGDKVLTGSIMKKTEAEASYEETLSEGNAAIMLEKNRDHSYSLNLGNLASHENCTITLRYAQTLNFEQHGLRLLIPTVIAPRYGDALQSGGLMPHQVPGHSLTAEYPFELELQLHGELTLARVASPSHPVSMAHVVTDTGPGLTVSLAREAALDRDFVLVLDQLAHHSISIAAKDCVEPERVAILASFCPRIAMEGTAPFAVKIVVDCSGSMAGIGIDSAKRALQDIVRQFGAGDHFSLSRFGSTVEHRSRGLWKANEMTKLAARQWVETLEADLGGTEMEAALCSTFALAQTVDSDVLLVTDGEISAIDQTIRSAKESGHRLFVVGIGSSPAESHLHRLAEATGGACDFVAPGEAVAPAVLRMFARLRSPRLNDLKVVWPADVTPEWVSPLLPSVFDGDTVNVFAWLRQAPSGEVRLLGRRSGDVAAQEIGSAAFAGDPGTADTLSRMVASACYHSADSAPDPVDLAVAYKLVTDNTNFLLVHERPDGEQATDMPRLQKVEQMTPAGWGGTGSVMFSRRSVHTPYVPDKSMMSEASTMSYSMDYLDSPKFLRRDDRIVDQQDLRFGVKTEHDTGLTPLEVSEWLHNRPVSEWPMTYMELEQMGLGSALLEFLDFAIATFGGYAHAESKVVEAFLYLMSTLDAEELLARSNSALESAAHRLYEIYTSDPAGSTANINLPLIGALVVALEGMTATTWPDRLITLGSAVD